MTTNGTPNARPDRFAHFVEILDRAISSGIPATEELSIRIRVYARHAIAASAPYASAPWQAAQKFAHVATLAREAAEIIARDGREEIHFVALARAADRLARA